MPGESPGNRNVFTARRTGGTMTDEKSERGAAEEASDAPYTPTEAQAAQTPPSQSSSDISGQGTGERDKAESAKNTDV
jgi:hypothetical protein